MKNTTVFVAVLLVIATIAMGCANKSLTTGILTSPIISVSAINLPIISLPIKPFPPPNNIPIIPTPTPPQGNCNCGSLSNKFTLSFAYACRPNVAYDSCKGKCYGTTSLLLRLSPMTARSALLHTLSLPRSDRTRFSSLVLDGQLRLAYR